MARVIPRPLPTTKYPDLSCQGYAPAPLDMISLKNGARKFVHSQHPLTIDEYNYALTYLHDMFPYLPDHSSLADSDEVELQLLVHADKSAGVPFLSWGAATKGDAYEKFGVQQIHEYYCSNTPIITATLKDELRPIGKDARFFRPQCVAAYSEGVRLFYEQNKYLTETLESPVFCRYIIPGPDMTTLFTNLQHFSPNNYAADGSSWDANFQLSVADVICNFRARGMPKENRERVRRYYSLMYNGYTEIHGEIVNIVGNPSGHYNTSVDNALAHMVLMAVTAFRKGLTQSQFRSELLYYACGDDLIWSSRNNVFNPHDLDEVYSSLGVYLEFEFLEPKDVSQLSFCGMSPCVRRYNHVDVPGYYLSRPRAMAALYLHKKKMSPKDVLAKVCSIAQLYFMYKPYFKYTRQLYMELLAKYVSNGEVSPRDVDVLGHIRAMEPIRLIRKYTSWE